MRLQNMPQFCHNLKNLSSPIDRFEPRESVCVDIAIPRLFVCAESECSICSAIQSSVKISENGWIAENRMNSQSWTRPLGKPMRIYGEWTAQKGFSSSIRMQLHTSSIDPSSVSAYIINKVNWMGPELHLKTHSVCE